MPSSADNPVSTLSISHSPRTRWRLLKNKIAQHSVGVGGISVIIAIVLIFFYLLYVVLPLFTAVEVKKVASYTSPGNADSTVHLAMDEYNEIGARFTEQGQLNFFHTNSGALIESHKLPIAKAAVVSSFAVGDAAKNHVIYGLNNGQAVVAQLQYAVSYPNNERAITPSVQYPMGKAALTISDNGVALIAVAIQNSAEEATIAAVTAQQELLLTYYAKEESFLDDEIKFERNQVSIKGITPPVKRILLSKEQRDLYLAHDNGQVSHYDLSDKEQPKLIQRVSVVDNSDTISDIRFLTGDISLLIGDSQGRVTQWFLVRNERGDRSLTPIRHFDAGNSPIRAIATEQRRKGFISIDQQGNLGLFHATAQRTLAYEKISDHPLLHATVSPRGTALLAEDEQGQMHFGTIYNEHPEISWSTLWGKVWYENYSEPRYLWQSSSADNDFEPKLSLTPLVFGTLKAAFYAMLFAIPLAIMGAIYTAYFMAPGMRKIVKPSIETMEALPTVILGFLAGLWLAPLVEQNLPGVFSLLIVMPFGILGFAFLWQVLPKNIRHLIPEGWTAALLIPVVVLLGWFVLSLSQPMEVWLFGGDMRAWMGTELGIDFDQRNSIVVGFAMGFAVIPTIFSIAEDAIFSVPRHLTYGSLALGATPWQTLTRVVILTASPGIFSAVMIGLGRAVGETMIVLMATGNTPVMDFSVFQGMRTLAANIAVEMPESEVDSTHYRVLFLAALVLFMFTFVFNTFAEIIRQRLRHKYSSL